MLRINAFDETLTTISERHARRKRKQCWSSKPATLAEVPQECNENLLRPVSNENDLTLEMVAWSSGSQRRSDDVEMQASRFRARDFSFQQSNACGIRQLCVSASHHVWTLCVAASPK